MLKRQITDSKILKSPWRTIIPGIFILILPFAGYYFWTPGKNFTDGRYNLSQNGVWIQHGWLALRMQ